MAEHALPPGSGLDPQRFVLHEDEGHVWVRWEGRWWRVVVIPPQDWPKARLEARR